VTLHIIARFLELPERSMASGMSEQVRPGKRRHEMEQSHKAVDQLLHHSNHHDAAVTISSTPKRPWQAPTLEKLDLFGTGSSAPPGGDFTFSS